MKLIMFKVLVIVIFLGFVYLSIAVRFELMNFHVELIKKAKDKQKSVIPKIIKDILGINK